MEWEDPIRVNVLGATGSIGLNTLDLIKRNAHQFRVGVLTAYRNAAQLAEIAIQVGAKLAVVGDSNAYSTLKSALSGTKIEAAAGTKALTETARLTCDITVAAIVGAAGLRPTLSALESGATLALANKECLVCAGSLFMNAAKQSRTTLLPIDSEHNAIFQTLETHNTEEVEKIILTASGGPFRDYSLERMEKASVKEALNHPCWQMGKRITIDSATMMNKGFEVIEAHHLYGLGPDQIEVLIHPQSIVHGAVQYRDGSLLAHMSTPDMRVQIANCLTWPHRIPTPAKRVDLAAIGSLTFMKPDMKKFPALQLAQEALSTGNGATAALNAADEVLVNAFLEEKIGLLDIVKGARRVLELMHRNNAFGQAKNIDDVMAVDEMARALAQEVI